MSNQELADIFWKDLPMLKNKLVKTIYHDYVIHLRNARKLFRKPEPKVYEVDGNRGLNYLIVLNNNDENEFRKAPAVSPYAWCIRAKGYYVMYSHETFNSVFHTREKSNTFYTSHFFDRYRERVLGDKTMDKFKAIKDFVKNNNDVSMPAQQDNVKYPNGMYVIYSNCIGIGQYNPDNIYECTMKTCIAFNNMFSNQQEMKLAADRDIENVKIQIENELRDSEFD